MLLNPLRRAYPEMRQTTSRHIAGKEAIDTLRQMADQLERNPDAIVHLDMHVDPRTNTPRLKSLKLIIQIGEADA